MITGIQEQMNKKIDSKILLINHIHDVTVDVNLMGERIIQSKN